MGASSPAALGFEMVYTVLWGRTAKRFELHLEEQSFLLPPV